MLTGHSLTGLYNTWQLRVFVPKEGLPLHIAQQEYMQQVHGECDTRVDRDIDEEGEQATADDDDNEPEICRHRVEPRRPFLTVHSNAPKEGPSWKSSFK